MTGKEYSHRLMSRREIPEIYLNYVNLLYDEGISLNWGNDRFFNR